MIESVCQTVYLCVGERILVILIESSLEPLCYKSQYMFYLLWIFLQEGATVCGIDLLENASIKYQAFLFCL
jgi:hypothetical protein